MMKNDTLKDNNEEEKPKENIITRTKNKGLKVFNIFYVITSLLSYLYYIFYVVLTIKKTGINNAVSICLLVFIGIYSILFILRFVFISNKQAKKTIKVAKSYLSYFKKIIKISSLAMSITVLVAAINAEGVDDLAMFVSIFNLAFTIFKILWTLFTMSASIGTKVVKTVVKKKINNIKQTKNNSKVVAIDPFENDLEELPSINNKE